MLLSDPLCHTASISVAVPAEKLFEFMTDAQTMGKWSFGSWDLQPAGQDIHVGTSLFNGRKTYIRIHADPKRLQLDYDVGESADSVVPRIVCKIIPGARLGMAGETCLLTLIAWRSATASDDRWRQTCASHELEIFRIKGLAEGAVR
ncbi:MAG TPA: hypothetical protein VJQ52_12065 [Steroidobacteraceae bacterium]|nr:hypothetical protein [Steroidobacteraceae bacterium]